MAVELLGAGERESAAALWAALEPRCPDRSLFAGWNWTESWLASYGDAVPHRFVAGRVGGEPVGIALLTFDRWRRGPLRLRRAHVGTAGEPVGTGAYVERNGLLALPAHARAFAAALIEAARRARRWDSLLLDGFIAADADALIGGGARWSAERERALVAELAAIDEGGPAAPFGTGVRREWRRAERIAGPFEVEWAQSPERALAILDELIDLHQARWRAAGRPGAFGAPRARSFHRELVRRLCGRGEVALTRVTGPGGLLGCRYDFVDGDRLVTYQNGWVAGGDERVSSGLAVDLACMGAARARGIRVWDWLAGEQRHKRRLSTGSYELVWASLRRGVVRWIAFDAARVVSGRLPRGAR